MLSSKWQSTKTPIKLIMEETVGREEMSMRCHVHRYDRARLAEVRSDRDLSKVTAGQRPAPRRRQCTLLFFLLRVSLTPTA